VLRVSGFLSMAEVRAEHRILRRLRQGGLAFQVPEPAAAPDGQTVIGTPAGPAAVCRWLPGVHPGMDGEAAFERFGRAAGPPGCSAPRWPACRSQTPCGTGAPTRAGSSRTTRRSTSCAASCAPPG
jgi:Ser/Thr protein kinase RdoA (MazF antagonist)